jgi:hypothetical protein
MKMTNERYAEIRAGVPKPAISKNFTIDDIHKIREWHYETTKKLTTKERRDFYMKGIEQFFKGSKKYPKILN